MYYRMKHEQISRIILVHKPKVAGKWHLTSCNPHQRLNSRLFSQPRIPRYFSLKLDPDSVPLISQLTFQNGWCNVDSSAMHLYYENPPGCAWRSEAKLEAFMRIYLDLFWEVCSFFFFLQETRNGFMTENAYILKGHQSRCEIHLFLCLFLFYLHDAYCQIYP